MDLSREELIQQLRSPPTMSMAMSYGHLYRTMADLMGQAAKELEKDIKKDVVKVWDCPLHDPLCKKNCGAYHCGN